jgi:hypothetical protein
VVAPFFSIENGERDDNGIRETEKAPTETEVYHLFMQAYPGYTIEKIEYELSWRVVNNLMNCWSDRPPLLVRTERIEQMIQKKLGFKFVNKKVSDETLLSELKGMGWL